MTLAIIKCCMVDAAIHVWLTVVILMAIPVSVTVDIHCREMATSVELMVQYINSVILI